MFKAKLHYYPFRINSSVTFRYVNKFYNYIIGKYGHLRLEYLKNHKKAEYIIMFMNKTLIKHIIETNK